MKFPVRKPNRLKEYNYSQNGAYFITICTKNKEKIFGEISNNNYQTQYAGVKTVGADSISARMVDEVFNKIINSYNNVRCSKYVIMPNHFHAIIEIERADMESAPTVSKIIQEFKRCTTIEYIKMVKKGMVPNFDKSIWQRSFHDHVIRNLNDYQMIWNYINTNPQKWKEDCFYGG